MSAFAVVLYPLWESRAALGQIFKGIFKVQSSFMPVTTNDSHVFLQDIFGKGSGKYVPPSGATEASA